MTVNELIKVLEEVDNKEREVCVYIEDFENIRPILYVDVNISDRVDLNINFEK